ALLTGGPILQFHWTSRWSGLYVLTFCEWTSRTGKLLPSSAGMTTPQLNPTMTVSTWFRGSGEISAIPTAASAHTWSPCSPPSIRQNSHFHPRRAQNPHPPSTSSATGPSPATSTGSGCIKLLNGPTVKTTSTPASTAPPTLQNTANTSSSAPTHAKPSPPNPPGPAGPPNRTDDNRGPFSSGLLLV